MKRLLFFCALFVSGTGLYAQTTAEVKFPPVDSSPADILYYPLNAAKVKESYMAPVIKIVYSRPSKKGREIFGVLEKYDTVWRLGANESTEITFNKTVTIGSKKVKPGQYSLFAIPSKDKWVLIVNKNTDRWGAFTYDVTKDIVRVEVPVKKLSKPVETFSMTFNGTDLGATLLMAWDTTLIELPIGFVK